MDIPWRFRCLMSWHSLKNTFVKGDHKIRISKDGSGAKTILFILPSDTVNAQIAAYFVKRDLEIETKTIRYLVHQNGIQHYPEQIKPSIITFNDEDLNWWGVINNPIVLDQIKSFRYDAMVDLNQEFQSAMVRLILELEIPIKIGFQSELADHLYSVIIQRSGSGFLEKNYNTIERILGLS